MIKRMLQILRETFRPKRSPLIVDHSDKIHAIKQEITNGYLKTEVKIDKANKRIENTAAWKIYASTGKIKA